MGRCRCAFNDSVTQVGKVVDGLRDSIWLEYKSDLLQLSEKYDRGKFVDGIRYWKGSQLPYSKLEEQPSYPGGYGEMMKVIARNMKMPASARRLGIDGTVMVSFIIAESGEPLDIKIVRGIHADSDKEAVRVVKLLGNWIPGKIRGRPVATRFNLPIKFKLN